MLNFHFPEGNPDPSLLVERGETAMLLVCEKVLARNVRQNDDSFLQPHNKFIGMIIFLTLIFWLGSLIVSALLISIYLSRVQCCKLPVNFSWAESIFSLFWNTSRGQSGGIICLEQLKHKGNCCLVFCQRAWKLF